MQVAVIGAGIVGASVAFRLSQGGARVWLVDEAEPASGTTSASFAWINANNKTPREYFELNRAGMEEHLRLRDELSGGASWLHQTGNLIWAEDGDSDELERRVGRLRSWGYAAEWWTTSRVVEELEPCATFGTPDTTIAFFPEEGWVDSPLLTKTFISLARRNGAEFRSGAVSSIEVDGGRTSGVRLADGSHLSADKVVNAAGPAADPVAALVGRNLPMKPKDGLLAYVSTKTRLPGRLLHTPHVNLRPDGPGHVLLHHSSVDEKLAGGGDKEQLAEELLGRAREIVPGLADAEIEEIRAGTRPVPADGFSCVGGLASLPGYYEAVTHSGVTLGPLVGKLLAREITTGEVDSLLAPFRPDRFGS